MKVYFMNENIPENIYPFNFVPENDEFKTRKELESFYNKI